MSNNNIQNLERKRCWLSPLTDEEEAGCKEEGCKQKKTKEEASLDLKPHVVCLVEELDLPISQLIYSHSSLNVPCSFKSTHLIPFPFQREFPIYNSISI